MRACFKKFVAQAQVRNSPPAQSVQANTATAAAPELTAKPKLEPYKKEREEKYKEADTSPSAPPQDEVILWKPPSKTNKPPLPPLPALPKAKDVKPPEADVKATSAQPKVLDAAALARIKEKSLLPMYLQAVIRFDPARIGLKPVDKDGIQHDLVQLGSHYYNRAAVMDVYQKIYQPNFYKDKDKFTVKQLWEAENRAIAQLCNEANSLFSLSIDTFYNIPELLKRKSLEPKIGYDDVGYNEPLKVYHTVSLKMIQYLSGQIKMDLAKINKMSPLNCSQALLSFINRSYNSLLDITRVISYRVDKFKLSRQQIELHCLEIEVLFNEISQSLERFSTDQQPLLAQLKDPKSQLRADLDSGKRSRLDTADQLRPMIVARIGLSIMKSVRIMCMNALVKNTWTPWPKITIPDAELFKELRIYNELYRSFPVLHYFNDWNSPEFSLEKVGVTRVSDLCVDRVNLVFAAPIHLSFIEDHRSFVEEAAVKDARQEKPSATALAAMTLQSPRYLASLGCESYKAFPAGKVPNDYFFVQSGVDNTAVKSTSTQSSKGKDFVMFSKEEVLKVCDMLRIGNKSDNEFKRMMDLVELVNTLSSVNSDVIPDVKKLQNQRKMLEDYGGWRPNYSADFLVDYQELVKVHNPASRSDIYDFESIVIYKFKLDDFLGKLIQKHTKEGTVRQLEADNIYQSLSNIKELVTLEAENRMVLLFQRMDQLGNAISELCGAREVDYRLRWKIFNLVNPLLVEQVAIQKALRNATSGVEKDKNVQSLLEVYDVRIRVERTKLLSFIVESKKDIALRDDLAIKPAFRKHFVPLAFLKDLDTGSNEFRDNEFRYYEYESRQLDPDLLIERQLILGNDEAVHTIIESLSEANLKVPANIEMYIPIDGTTIDVAQRKNKDRQGGQDG